MKKHLVYKQTHLVDKISSVVTKTTAEVKQARMEEPYSIEKEVKKKYPSEAEI